MTRPVLILAAALGWAAITGSFSVGNLLLGAVIGAVAVILTGRRSGAGGIGKLGRIASLAGLFTYELFASAIRVAALVVRPDMATRLTPAIVAFPLTAKSDGEITLLANLITLTPGTLSVDVSADRRFLYVHALDCPDRDALVRSIAEGFERKVIEVFK